MSIKRSQRKSGRGEAALLAVFAVLFLFFLILCVLLCFLLIRGLSSWIQSRASLAGDPVAESRREDFVGSWGHSSKTPEVLS